MAAACHLGRTGIPASFVRVGLHVILCDRTYHVVHVGFFPRAVASGVADHVDAAGLSFGRYADELGRVDVVLATSADGETWTDSEVRRTVEYGTRRGAGES